MTAIIDNPIGSGILQFGIGCGGTQRDYSRARRLAGANARGDILDNDTFLRLKSKERGCLQIGLRMRLTIDNVRRGNQLPGNLQARGPKTHLGESARA